MVIDLFLSIHSFAHHQVIFNQLKSTHSFYISDGGNNMNNNNRLHSTAPHSIEHPNPFSL